MYWLGMLQEINVNSDFLYWCAPLLLSGVTLENYPFWTCQNIYQLRLFIEPIFRSFMFKPSKLVNFPLLDYWLGNYNWEIFSYWVSSHQTPSRTWNNPANMANLGEITDKTSPFKIFKLEITVLPSGISLYNWEFFFIMENWLSKAHEFESSGFS